MMLFGIKFYCAACCSANPTKVESDMCFTIEEIFDYKISEARKKAVMQMQQRCRELLLLKIVSKENIAPLKIINLWLVGDMESFIGAHYFSLPTQGNVYTVVPLPLVNGKNKTLVATLKRKVFSCEFLQQNNTVVPVVKEVPFTYIPSGAEIISIDAFNRSQTSDDFFIGITIIKVNADQSTETYLNVYTEQEVEDKAELNLDSLAQNCLMLELPFIPYQLYHTTLLDFSKSNEIVWLLSGSDLKVHLFREDPMNHTYCEIEAEELFPEFTRLPGIVLWIDIKHTNGFERRLTAFGCECGTLKFYYVDVVNNSILMNLTKHFDAPISKVLLFKLKEENTALSSKYFDSEQNKEDDIDEKYNNFNLLVVNTLQPSTIFMDIGNKQLDMAINLPESDKFDSALCACAEDINMDCKKEIIIGTYSKMLLEYVYKNETWILHSQHKFPHSVHSILYIDLTDDGLKELLVVTMLGVNIFQHNLQDVLEKFKSRFILNKFDILKTK